MHLPAKYYNGFESKGSLPKNKKKTFQIIQYRLHTCFPFPSSHWQNTHKMHQQLASCRSKMSHLRAPSLMGPPSKIGLGRVRGTSETNEATKLFQLIETFLTSYASPLQATSYIYYSSSSRLPEMVICWRISYSVLDFWKWTEQGLSLSSQSHPPICIISPQFVDANIKHNCVNLWLKKAYSYWNKAVNSINHGLHVWWNSLSPLDLEAPSTCCHNISRFHKENYEKKPTNHGLKPSFN